MKQICFRPSSSRGWARDRSPKASISETCKTHDCALTKTARWVEVCYCPTPLLEERPHWEQYFDLTRVQDAHDRRTCRDENGTEPWACGDCDCTARLEQKLKASGESFLVELRNQPSSGKLG